MWRVFLGKGKDLITQSESKEVSILKLYVVLSLTLVLFPSLFIGSASFNSSLWIFIRNCLNTYECRPALSSGPLCDDGNVQHLHCAINLMWPLSMCNGTSRMLELNFKFYLILINLNYYM